MSGGSFSMFLLSHLGNVSVFGYCCVVCCISVEFPASYSFLSVFCDPASFLMTVTDVSSGENGSAVSLFASTLRIPEEHGPPVSSENILIPDCLAEEPAWPSGLWTNQAELLTKVTPVPILRRWNTIKYDKKRTHSNWNRSSDVNHFDWKQQKDFYFRTSRCQTLSINLNTLIL